MKLTNHFSLSEFTSSQTASRNGIDNTPSQEIIGNIKRVAAHLEEVREACGNHSVIITSGYRSPALNKVIGGSKASAHMLGLAADIIIPGYGTPKEVAKRIIEAGLLDDTLIFEGTWVHFGITSKKKTPRKRVMTATFHSGRASYSCGIL